MQAQDYMTLQTIRLKSSEEMSLDREGFVFIFLKGGVGKYISPNAGQRLIPGDMLVMKGNNGGKLCVSNRAEVVYWSFFLRLEHLIPLFDGKEISLLQCVTTGLNSPKLLPASTALAKECRRLIEGVPPQVNLDHRSQLLRVAATILSEEFNLAHGQRMRSVSIEDRLVRVFKDLKTDELLNLSVEELAGKFGCTRRHLNRLFHQFFGHSVAALRLEIRLLKAISLLRDLDAKIIHVAEQCGFNHMGLFNTCFKKRFGRSPGVWRKQNSNGDNSATILQGIDLPCPALQTKEACSMPTERTGHARLASQTASN